MAAVIVLTPACARQQYHAIDLKKAISHGDPVRVTMKDGRIFALEKPVVANDSLMGVLPGKPVRDVAVPVNEVYRVERMQSGPKAIIAVLLGLTLGIIYTTYCC